MIAAASIICAMKGIQMKMDSDRVSCVCSVVKTNSVEVENIAAKIERIVSNEISHLNESSTSKLIDNNNYETVTTKYPNSEKSKKPETPVDVQNVNF